MNLPKVTISCLYIILIASLLGTFGCAAKGASGDKLSSELYQLATSRDPGEFAETHGITLTNNSVKVIIEITDDFRDDLITHYRLKEVKRLNHLIEADVHIGDLISLSEDKGVKYIRRPRKFRKM